MGLEEGWGVMCGGVALCNVLWVRGEDGKHGGHCGLHMCRKLLEANVSLNASVK